MLKFTAEQIQAQFDKLPKSVQDAVTSTTVHDDLISISKKYNLMIDQEGVLVDQIGMVMLGLSPSRDFVKNFSDETGVDTKIATAIAEDINKEIFSKIKTSMRTTEEEIEKTTSDQISSVEQAGNFTIEPEQGAQDTQNADQSIESPSEVINHIENPEPAQPNTDTLLIDHLLSGPVVAVEKKTEQKQAVAPTTSIPKQTPDPSKPDPYRESV